jgi:hypothetical protein
MRIAPRRCAILAPLNEWCPSATNAGYVPLGIEVTAHWLRYDDELLDRSIDFWEPGCRDCWPGVAGRDYNLGNEGTPSQD